MTIAPDTNLAATRLEAQIDHCHTAAMRLFECALDGMNEYSIPYSAMKLAAQLMQAGAQASLVLQRLKNPGTHHTVTVRKPKAGKGRVPTPEIAKTNGAA